MKSSSSVLALCWVMFTSGALAAPASSESSNDAPDLPPARVELRVEPLSDSTFWRMLVLNRGTEAVRIAADARLLTLEVHPPEPVPSADADSALIAKGPAASAVHRAKSARDAKPKVLKCQLPAGMRPVEVDDDRALVLPPGRAYEEVFDPALYCFGSDAAATWTKGGDIIASLGFSNASPPPGPASKKKPKAPKGPFVVEPARFPATVAPVSELVAPPVTRPAAPVSADPTAAPNTASAASPAGDDDDQGAPRLDLTANPYVDANGTNDISLAVWIKNTGHRPLRALLRRDGLTFEVNGPTGSTFCGDPRPFRTSPPDTLSVVAPGQRVALDVLLGEICPDGTFDRPGLYRVRTLLTAFSTVAARQSQTGVWSGTATTDARTPSLVRVKTGPSAFHSVPPTAR
jgi:hypothetical protein